MLRDHGDDERAAQARVLAEQCYRAVLEVRGGHPVIEVAIRCGVTRQTVTIWRKRYERLSLEGLREFSRRPHHSPRPIAGRGGGVGVRVAPRAPPVGPLDGSAMSFGAGAWIRVPSDATVHRVLVRNGLVRAQDQRRECNTSAGNGKPRCSWTCSAGCSC